MAYSTSIDTFNDPVSGNPFSLSSGESQTTKWNKVHAALRALEAKTGVDTSAVTTSLDYLMTFALATQVLIPFSHKGQLVVGAGTLRMPLPQNYTLTSFTFMVNTPSVGGPVTLDLNYDGTTVATGTKASAAAASNIITTAMVFTTTTLTSAHYLSVDFDAVGSTTPAADLAGVIGLKRR